MAFLYSHWLIHCKVVHAEFVFDNELHSTILNEIRKIILRLQRDGKSIDEFQPLIQHFNTETLDLQLNNVFHHG